MFYDAKLFLDQKLGPSFFKKRSASAAPGAFYKPGRAGNGKHVNMESLVSSGTERPKTTQRPPRAPRDPQRPPEAPREASKDAQKPPEAPKSLPDHLLGLPLGDPAGHPETPRGLQRAQKLPDAPKGPPTQRPPEGPEAHRSHKRSP